MKCIEVAQKAMADKDFSKAERFLEKSLKFEFSNKAQNLLYSLDTIKRREAETSSQTPSQPTSEKSAPPEPKKPEYTSA